MKYLPYWLVVIAAIILDQISKYAILARFEYQERLNIIPHFFDLTLVYNPGAAFSFLAGMGGAQKYLFIVLAFAISGYLARAFQFDGVTLSVAKGYCLDLGRPTRRDCLQ